MNNEPVGRQMRVGGTSPMWVILAMVIGFILPVCTLLVMGAAGLVGTGWLISWASGQEETGEGDGVGVLDLSGVILQGEGFSGVYSTTTIENIEWLEENDEVKAIVVLANSPGGDANASDIIWQRLSQVDKPVFVFVNGLCASGCYYIAMGADANQIYATPNSLIGSIGVISTFLTIEELADEIGVDMQVVATGENKDFGNPFRRLTEDEIAYWREQILITLDNFIAVVVAGRPNLTEAQIREMANGRVWSSKSALEMGLIDGIEYEEGVFLEAAKAGGISDPDFRRIEPPYEPTLSEFLFGTNSTIITDPPNSLSYEELMDLLQQPPIQYRYLGPATGVSELD